MHLAGQARNAVSLRHTEVLPMAIAPVNEISSGWPSSFYLTAFVDRICLCIDSRAIPVNMNTISSRYQRVSRLKRQSRVNDNVVQKRKKRKMEDVHVQICSVIYSVTLVVLAYTERLIRLNKLNFWQSNFVSLGQTNLLIDWTNWLNVFAASITTLLSQLKNLFSWFIWIGFSV